MRWRSVFDSGRGGNARDDDAPRLRPVPLADGAYAIGNAVSGPAIAAEVAAVRRRKLRTPEPSGGSGFESGGVVVLIGVPGALARAGGSRAELAAAGSRFAASNQ